MYLPLSTWIWTGTWFTICVSFRGLVFAKENVELGVFNSGEDIWIAVKSDDPWTGATPLTCGLLGIDAKPGFGNKLGDVPEIGWFCRCWSLATADGELNGTCKLGVYTLGELLRVPICPLVVIDVGPVGTGLILCADDENDPPISFW